MNESVPQITLNSTSDRVTSANRVTVVGFFINLLLTAGKLAAGIFGHSSAMVADALHSLSDFATDIIVLVCFRIIGQPIDKNHDYGHGKFETFASVLVGATLFAVGIGILVSGVKKIWFGLHGTTIITPNFVALLAAVISIVSKEWLYRYTAKVGRKIDSQAVIANAWHHRSDAFSSIGTAIGIGGAIVLGGKWHILDPIAAVIVSFFIIKVAGEIAITSLHDLMEQSLDEEIEKEIIEIAANIEGTLEPHELRTRRIGSTVAIDLHIYVDRNLKVIDAHDIATNVENALRERFGQETFVSVHMEPGVVFG
ncbi:MAG: cation transporter [Calditrichaeota bacterium]|nr:MAG: cation transporter [Calditrichota bacterium]